MNTYHDVNIYLGTELATSSTRLEVASSSSVLHHLIASMNICDGCREPTSIIFPSEDETMNSLQDVFKSMIFNPGERRYSIVESKLLYS